MLWVVLFNTLLFLPTAVVWILFGLAVGLTGRLLKLPNVFTFGWNVLIAVDQFGNVMWLGSTNETISSRTHRALRDGTNLTFVRPLAKIIDILFAALGDENHIAKSYEEARLDDEIWQWSKRPTEETACDSPSKT